MSGEKRLSDYVHSIVRSKNLGGAFFSIKLVDYTSGKTLFEYNPQLRMIPASTQKAITTGIGLTVLGEYYTFKTRVYYDGTVGVDSILYGNLYIIGGGDPTLGSENFPISTPETVFDKIVRGLKSVGIAGVYGNVITDNSYFDSERSTSETVHPSWEREDMGSHYGAGVHGLNFCENYFTTTISNKTSAGIVIRPDYPYIRTATSEIVSDVTIIHRDSLPSLTSFSSPDACRYLIRGELPAGKEVELDCALQNPAVALEFWLSDYFAGKGIPIYNKGIDLTFEREKRLLMEIESPPYYELARFANYTSNNLVADAVFKNISKQTTGECSFSKSAECIHSILQAMNLDVQNIRIVDGSGLSRQNLMTSEFMCGFLRAIEERIPGFHFSLPSPGTDKSTLKYFMTTYPTETRKRIFLKSGSMTGVMNYAGYIVSKSGKTMCITVMANNFLCPKRTLKPVLEQLVYLISDSF
jgi:D-alanyl-D-alanine carboxypeptidase/D-alanyl-D-alanine-endopeptidase (penicillin-binding protein 4)